MMSIIILILWMCLAPVIDGLIYPDLFYNHFQGGLPVWVYLVYVGVLVLLILYVYFRYGVIKE